MSVPHLARGCGRVCFAALTLFALGCSRKPAIVVSVEDPNRLAAGAALLAFGADLGQLTETRPLDGRSFPLTVTLVSSAGDDGGPLFVEARNGAGKTLARARTEILFDGAETQALSVMLQGACEGDLECQDNSFCNGREVCTEGTCAAGTPPCGEAVEDNCFAAFCVESEKACGLRLSPDLDDTNPCSLDTCEAHRPKADGEVCSIEAYSGACRAGRCDLCPPGAEGCAERVVRLDAGEGYTCAARGGGRVFCWGASGLVGAPAPAEVPGLSGVVALSVGEHHGCAARADGTVRCWGLNPDGELGIPPDPGFHVVDVAGLDGVTAVSAGTAHTCALKTDGHIECWGQNAFGQLGDGSTQAHDEPAPVLALEGVTAIAAGAFHTCALKSDLTVHCWGLNQDAQLGNASSAPRTMPTRVMSLGQAMALAAGDAHTCAVLIDGHTACWGANASGQLGNGTTRPEVTPVVVPNLNGVVAIDAGPFHTCALRGGGAVACFGENSHAQLGAPRESFRTQPTFVATPPGAINLTAGDAHGCAAQADGAVYCWGRNLEGELDGTRTSTPTPTPVRVQGF